MRDLAKATWRDFPANPLIEPRKPDWLLADPTVLTPDRSPDGKWHLFANGVGFILHFKSDDGIAWEQVGQRLFRGFRAFIYPENGTFYLLYELHARNYRTSRVVARQSADLEHWSEPQTLAEPTFDWDGQAIRFVGNPCLLKIDGRYRLYYSTSWIWLWDCLYFEPRYVGYAEADAVLGPYKRHPLPLLGPDPAEPYRNFGGGSLKVYADGKKGFWAFNNGLYRDAEGRSRSAILLLRSGDGLYFEAVHDRPIIAPEPGWKNAFVYAFDLVAYRNELRLYYNARDGWLRGRECIGFAAPEW
ncbi:MAG: glycosyl hydrolase family 43 [Myxococcales bacterium]|nr:glycosyl hydrolase family 43 [Myxococcales bacterium]